MNIQSIDDCSNGLGVWDSENHWGVIGHDFTWIFHTQKINGCTMEPYFSMACFGSLQEIRVPVFSRRTMVETPMFELEIQVGMGQNPGT
jgi:hypothetical protein